MNLTREKEPLTVGDRYVALPGSRIAKTATLYVEFADGTCLRMDESHPCGAYEYVVIDPSKMPGREHPLPSEPRADEDDGA